MFECAQDVALAQARAWCDRQLTQLKRLPVGVAALPTFFAGVVDEWAQSQRKLAFAWREGQLLSARQRIHEGIGEKWSALWSAFWRGAGDRFGLRSNIVVVERVFETESLLHMLRWDRLFDRAGLDEMAQGLAAWISGTPMPPSPWRDAARMEAARSMPELPERGTVAATIMDAAAQVLEQRGVAGLSHRAVAARSGLTLGVVLHNFHTKSELLTAAYERVYLANIGQSSRSGQRGASAPQTGDGMETLVAGISRSAGVLGMEDLILAAARDPALAQFAVQLRYLRGRSSVHALEMIAGSDRQYAPLEAALFSGFASSLARIYRNGDPALLLARMRAELEVVRGCIRSTASRL